MNFIIWAGISLCLCGIIAIVVMETIQTIRVVKRGGLTTKQKIQGLLIHGTVYVALTVLIANFIFSLTNGS